MLQELLGSSHVDCPQISDGAGRGKEAGDDLTHTNTHINAGNTVVVRSGGDMASQGKYGVAKAVIGNALNNASESGSSSGQTLTTVSGARVTITNETAQKALTGQTAEEAVASLNRDTHAAHTAAQKQDAQAMQQRVEAERASKQETIKAVTALTDEAHRSRMQQAPKLLKVECPAGQDCSKSPELLVRSEMTKFARRQGLTAAELVLAATLSTAVAAANCRPAMGLKATTHLAHYSMLEASKTAPGPRPPIAAGKAHLHKLAAILPPLTWSRRFALWLKS